MDRIDAMGAFVAAAELGSLTQAARRIGRSPAAVTRAVALLEQRTGTRLLHRTTRVVRLTEAGSRYLANCRRILADLTETELLAGGAPAAPRGLLTVTAPTLLGRLHAPPLVARFLGAHPAVQAPLFV